MDIVPQLIVNSIIAGSTYALIAMSFNFVFGATRFFNLAHGVLSAVAGYTVLYLARSFGLDFFLSTLIGIAVAGLLGYLLEVFLYRPLRARKSSALVLLVASLGAFTALQAFIAILFTSQFQTLSRFADFSGTFHIGTGVMTYVQGVMLASAVGVLILFWLLLKYTKFGKAVRAVSDDEEVAKIVGIDTNRVIGYVFLIGSAVAGLAGILIGLDTGLEPTMGLQVLLKGVIAAIVGGIGNVYGAFLGAFLLGAAENFGIWHISGQWKDAIAFALLILFFIFRPQGILGKK